MTCLTSILRWVREPVPRVERRLPRIEPTDAGFDLIGPDAAVQHVRWSALTRVVTLKYDLFAVDEIVLIFETGSTAIEVSEDCAGFGTLFEPLERELGVNPEWYQTVMRPAFATNYRVIYERSGSRLLPSDSDGRGE